MKKRILRIAAILLICALALPMLFACSGKTGKPMLTLKKDGISVSLSVNFYELMLSRMKGTLCFYGYTANGVTANYDGFWDFSDKFNGEDLQTIDEYYCGNILDNCYTFLVSLYLFEKEGLTLSATAEQEIEDRLYELLRTDGNGSKTKLNSVLAAYGVNYDILKEAYTIEAKVSALQEHLYGENASKLGYEVKDQYMNEHYVHFRQIFLSTYHYVYETDANGDVIYYYSEGDNKDHIYYDVYNGEVGYDENGNEKKDKNGDVIYYVKDTDQTKIAYDSTNGMPAYVPNENGSDFKTEDMTEEELAQVTEKAQKLYEELEGSTYTEFEAVMEKESDDMAESGEYDDGYYLEKGLDFTAKGDDYLYLDQIVTALESMEDGEIAMIRSNFGYHIIKKYPHTEKAYEKECNQTWFENFAQGLVEELFLEKCKTYFDSITVDQKVYASAPTMKEVGVNYNY